MAFDGSTIAAATTGVFFSGVFEDSFTVSGADVDMVALDLVAGRIYSFDVDNGMSGDLALRIFNQFGTEVRANDDGSRFTDDVTYSPSPYLEFAPEYSGRYYAAVSPHYLLRYDPTTTQGRVAPENPLPATAGTLTVLDGGPNFWPSTGSIASIDPEGNGDKTDLIREEDRQLRVSFFGAVDTALDVDIARFDLLKGDVIVVEVNGLDGNGTVLRIFDDDGTQIGFDDNSGTGPDPELVFAATALGDYYVGVSGDGNATYNAQNGTGTLAGVVGEYEVILHRNPSFIGTSLANTFNGSEAADLVVGLAGNDSLSGNAGRDTLSGGDDADTLVGGLGNDILYGDGGNDSLSGSQGNDVLVGGYGDDFLNGSVGNDLLEGGGGDDRLQGRDGEDTLYGGAGEDTLAGGDGADLYFGGVGNDEMDDSSGNDTMFGGGGDDRLYGGIGNDSLSGDGENDTLGGGEGNDTLAGGSGNDFLSGGAGNDRLIGGAGNDTLRGGQGDDRFVFLSTAEGLDLIEDFSLAADDRIDLSAIFDGTGSVVTGANLAQFVQVTPAGAGTDSFLGVDADGATGGLSFTVIAQLDGVTPAQLFDTSNFIL
jgi:Ca2+-binding RTX toxin-like protein